MIDAFVEELDLAALGFARVQPAATGRPGYAPGTMLKLYVYGYLHQLTSSRKLEREAGRNIELMWLVSKLVPDFKCVSACKIDPVMEWALLTGHNQVASVTMRRTC